jgi:drug/metabolite transporter (DMT)-like permease
MKNLLGVLAGLAAAAIWGGMYVVSKVVLNVVPPFALLSMRLLLGAVVIGAVLLIRPSTRQRIAPRVIGVALGVGAIGFGLSLGLQFVGTRLSNASNASLVTSASPAFMLGFAIWLLRERATSRRLVALAVATIGVLVVVDPTSARLDLAAFWGNLALLGAALTWGLYSVLAKWTSRQLPVLAVSMYGFFGGLILALPAAGLELRVAAIGPTTLPILLGIIYLGVVSTAVAVFLWNHALATLDASVVSLLFFAQPLVGAGLGTTLLGEQLPATFWIGGAMIVLGVLLVSWTPLKHQEAIQLPGGG